MKSLTETLIDASVGAGIVLAVLAVAWLLSLDTDAAKKQQPSPQGVTGYTPTKERLFLFVDKETGCEYLSTYDGGLTARMEGGTHKGCKK